MSALDEALGRQAVLALSKVAGGRTLRVPSMDAKSANARAKLITLVGVHLAESLIVNFAHTRVYVPTGGAPVHNSRSNPIPLRRFVELRRQGHSVAQIAETVGCSERAVFAGLAEWRDLITDSAVSQRAVARKTGYSQPHICALRKLTVQAIQPHPFNARKATA